MPIRSVQPSFAGGEISPSIYSRTDISKYQTSLKTCRNFVVHTSGGASNTPGTRFVKRSKYYDTKTCRVQEFIFNREQRYVLEVGEEYIRFYTAGAIIEVITSDLDAWSIATPYVKGDFVQYGSLAYYCIVANTGEQPDTQVGFWTQQTIFEVPTPYQEDDLADLNFESSADTIFITTNDYQTRVLQRFGEADWRISLYEPEDGPFMSENDDDDFTVTPSMFDGSGTLTASEALFDADHVGALWKFRHYVESQTVSQDFGSATSSTLIKCFTTWRLITHGTWTATFKIEKSTDSGSTWTTLRTFSGANDFNANTSGTEDIDLNPEPFYLRITVSSYTSGTLSVVLTTDPFFQDGVVQITAYTSPLLVNATVLKTLGFATATNAWSEGSWSDFRGWPAVCRFYQDRLCFANTPSEPMTGWITQTGNYYSFLRHSTLLATDGITFNIPSRQLNAINGLLAFDRLILFTSGSIWSIGPPEGSAFTPNDPAPSLKVEEYVGSQGINPAVVGSEAIYVQANGKVIRNIGYEFSSNRFTGSDLNVLSRHLIENWEITDIAYQRDPDSIVWMVRSDGVLIGMTYMKEQEVVAWHRHDSIDEDEENFQGIVESICVVPSDGFDELWMVVQRNGGRYIERMVLRLESSDGCGGIQEVRLEDQIFMHSAVTYSPTTIDIASIEVLSDGTVRITALAHGLAEDTIIRLDGIVGMEDLNGNAYKVGEITTDTFKLFEVT